MDFTLDNFLLSFCRHQVAFQIVLTKCDLVTAVDLARRHVLVEKGLAEFRHAVDKPLMVSSETSAGIFMMRKEMLRLAGGLDRARKFARRNKVSTEDAVGTMDSLRGKKTEEECTGQNKRKNTNKVRR